MRPRAAAPSRSPPSSVRLTKTYFLWKALHNRKNYLFAGVNPVEYLADVLPRLARGGLRRHASGRVEGSPSAHRPCR